MKLLTRFCIITTLLLCIAAATSYARIWNVGPSRAYTMPGAVSSLVSNGDTVLIDTGTYAGEVSVWRADNLLLRGVGEFARMIAPASIPNGKGIWVVQGKNTVIENIEFSGAKVPDLNGAGIRQEGNNVTIRHCYFHHNENGILGSGDTTSAVIIENCEFAYNGAGDGYSHNMYIGRAGSFTLKFCNTHHAKIGHNVKTRARVNHILYNRIMDESDGTASYEIDIPDGGTSYLVGNLVQQGPATDNPVIIAYAEESRINPGRDLYVVNNTVVNDRTSGGTFIWVNTAASRARIVNNLFVGTGTVISGPGDTVTNLVTADPGFVNKAGFEYHLGAGSPAINKGSDPGTANTFVLAPSFQYAAGCNSTPRVSVGIIDIGAYESGMSDAQVSMVRNRRTGAPARPVSTYILSGRRIPPCISSGWMRRQTVTY